MKKWRPKEGEKYWYVLIVDWIRSIKVESEYWSECEKSVWNTFRTKREAERARKKIERILRGE